jgi:hypothetical protein
VRVDRKADRRQRRATPSRRDWQEGSRAFRTALATVGAACFIQVLLELIKALIQWLLSIGSVMTTISSNTTIGIYLGPQSYVNPIVIDPGVTVSNSGNAVYASSGYWEVQNGGTIFSTSLGGVDLLAGGSVTNTASASITGVSAGILFAGGAGTVINSGTVAGADTGVLLEAGGSVTNAASASIKGTSVSPLFFDKGVQVDGGAGTVVNSGFISGIHLAAGGTVINSGIPRLNEVSGEIACLWWLDGFRWRA